MSNSLAIATVTAALREVLQPVVGQAVSGAQIFFNRPDGTTGTPPTPAVNVYLYQVTPNSAFRNDDLPTRRSDSTGTVTQRPQAALDLHYLFTFHGNDTNLEPQLLLGAVVSTLHAQPLLPHAAIGKVTRDVSFLHSSNLSTQAERIKFTPTALALEEFSKLWSVFFQVEYSLSVAYQASVVLIESDERPVATLPVLTRNIALMPFRWPYIDRVVSQAGAGQMIMAGSTLLIQGQQLKGDTTVVLIEGEEQDAADVQDTQVRLHLPKSIHAGARSLQVVQKLHAGPVLHRESNVATFILRPTITGSSSAPADPGVTAVTVNLTPNLGANQRVVLILNSVAGTPAAFTSDPVISGPDTQSDHVSIKIAGVPTGKYLVRVQIDGAESLLSLDSSGQLSSPTVTMP